MSFNLTYGSFGDAIATAQLVYRLAQALSASRGSARELQDLVVELRLFQNVLQQLIIFWESKRQCSQLDDLANIARPAILDCKDMIKTFLEKAATKYGRSLLRQIGSRKTLWDVIKMIQWNFCEKEDVKKLRDQLSRSRATIQLIQVQAHGLASDQDQKAVSDRIASLVNAEREAATKIDERFAELMENLEKDASTLSRIEQVLNAVSSAVSSISNNVLAIRDAALSIDQGVTMLHGITRLGVYNHNTVYIEDALGWMLPIILDAQPSWETVHSILKDQFVRHGGSGLKLVESKRYSIQDSGTGRDVKFTIPFYQMVRPGQKFAMSMLFSGDWISEDEHSKKKNKSKCRRCGHLNMVVDSDVDITCQRCQFIYRIVIDMSDMDEKQLNDWAAHQDRLHIRNDYQTHEGEDEDDIHDRCSKDIETLVQEGLSRSEGPVDGPDVFKRVKFLTRWEDRYESRGNLWITIGNIHFWSTSSQGVASMARYEMAVSLVCQIYLYQNWIWEGQPRKIATRWKRTIGMRIAFAGYSREKSLPIIIITSYSKKARTRAMKVLKLLDWLGTPSRFSILTPPPSVIGLETPNHDDMKRKLSHKSRVIMESQRRIAVYKNRNPRFELSSK